jgi:hypothetical protein
LVDRAFDPYDKSIKAIYWQFIQPAISGCAGVFGECKLIKNGAGLINDVLACGW